MFSRGVWALAATIDRIRSELEAERATDGYAKRKESDARRREQVQAEYIEDFFGAVLKFLGFHPNHAALANRLASAVTDHATPVGSGTVARTKRIPVERRAEGAPCAGRLLGTEPVCFLPRKVPDPELYDHCGGESAEDGAEKSCPAAPGRKVRPSECFRS